MKTWATDLITDKKSIDVDGNEYKGGLTKREHFACLAMQGMLANSYTQDMIVQNPLSTATFEELAKMSVLQADALIEALNK